MKDYSQNGEQAVILETFEALRVYIGNLMDLGAGDGRSLSNTRALIERGWTGHLYDGDPKGAQDVKQLWITEDAIRDLLTPGHWSLDLLNIDLDGNDYWILRAFLAHCKPSVIVAEINPIFQRDEAVVMPYSQSHVWNNDTYYGMSLGACEKLAEEFGYTLMHLHAGINAFLLRNDHAKAHPELIRPVDYRVKFDHRNHEPGKKWQRV